MIDNYGLVIGSFDTNIEGTLSFYMGNNFTLTNFWVGPGEEGFQVNVEGNKGNFPQSAINSITSFVEQGLQLITSPGFSFNLFENLLSDYQYLYYLLPHLETS